MSLDIPLSNARTSTAPDCLAQRRVSIQEVDDEDGTLCSGLSKTLFLTCIRAAQRVGLPLGPGTHLLEPVSPHVSTSIGENDDDGEFLYLICYTIICSTRFKDERRLGDHTPLAVHDRAPQLSGAVESDPLPPSSGA
jgi:hypothetical protein